MKKFFIFCTVITLIQLSNIYTIAGDFGRRYGASSRLLQRPLYFKDSKRFCKKDCIDKEPCITSGENIKKINEYVK